MKFYINCASMKTPPVDNAEQVARSLCGELIYVVEVNTIEELLKIASVDNRGIVISKSECDEYADWEITIYDHDIE